MGILNLGIVAHVDAGKTSLTERLLFAAGVIDEIGSVDDGSTRTDSMALERQRGITIKSAVVSFAVGGDSNRVTVNLIDTPGHPDFIAEVERVLGVLDGAVLVISAVEGVQAQTRVLMRALQRLRIPTLIFVNKIDRRGAQDESLLRRIAETLTADIVPMVTVSGLGDRAACCTPNGPSDLRFTDRLAELLAEHDDAVLEAYVDDERAVSHRRLRRELVEQTRRAVVYPVYFGSAITGAGLDELIAGLTELLPSPVGAADGPAAGTVFKIERGPAGERIAYVRLFSGTLRVRDRPAFDRGASTGRAGKITAISVFDRGAAEPRAELTAGRIGRVWGLDDVRIGDSFGDAPANPSGAQFAPPSLETVVVPDTTADRGRLHLALTQLAEQDPLIDLRQDDVRGEIAVSLYGEVQKEVIEATLATDFGVAVSFRETTTICIERPAGSGASVEIIGTGSNPFLATVGLRVDPAAIDSGVTFNRAVELGSMPYAFFAAVEETVHDALRQGLFGWQVTDCTVTMTHSGYWPRQSHAHATFDKSMSSTAGDFRNLTPLVLMSALRRAGSTVYEPIHRFQLEIPADTFGPVMRALGELRAVPHAPEQRGSSCLLDGEIPAARVHTLRGRLPALTSGEGVLESAFDHYRPVSGRVPVRARTDHNPLHRKEYLLRVQRRV